MILDLLDPPILDFGFGGLDLGILEFGFWILEFWGLGFAILEFLILDLGILGFGFGSLDVGFWILEFVIWIWELWVWILILDLWFGVWNVDSGFKSFGPVLMKLRESEIEFSQTFKYLGSTLSPGFWMFFGICCFETHILLAKHPSLCVGPLLSETSRLWRLTNVFLGQPFLPVYPEALTWIFIFVSLIFLSLYPWENTNEFVILFRGICFVRK